MFGDFSGVRIFVKPVNHQYYFLEKNDYKYFEKLCSELRNHIFAHLELTRYEEDSLHLHTNNERGWLMYLREPGDSGLYIENRELVSKEKIEKFQCTCSISLEFPQYQTVTKDEGIEIAKEFYLKGTLPDKYIWKE